MKSQKYLEKKNNPKLIVSYKSHWISIEHDTIACEQFILDLFADVNQPDVFNILYYLQQLFPPFKNKLISMCGEGHQIDIIRILESPVFYKGQLFEPLKSDVIAYIRDCLSHEEPTIHDLIVKMVKLIIFKDDFKANNAGACLAFFKLFNRQMIANPKITNEILCRINNQLINENTFGKLCANQAVILNAWASHPKLCWFLGSLAANIKLDSTTDIYQNYGFLVKFMSLDRSVSNFQSMQNI